MPRDIGPNPAIAQSRGLDNPLGQQRNETAVDQFANEQLFAPENTSEQFKQEMHSAAKDFETGIDHIHKKEEASKNPLWLAAEKFLKDKWPVRKAFALGNEMAESFKGLLFNWLPQPIAWVTHKILWSLAILSTGSRVAANAKFAPKKEDQVKAGAKMLLHDGFAAIGVPTLWVNYVTDPLQDKLYKAIKLPEKIADVLRSAVSLISCYFVISKLDEPAKIGSAKLLRYSEDRHKQINEKPSPQLSI